MNSIAQARMEDRKAREISLAPPEHTLVALENDYRHMQNMIFGLRPSFAVILETIRQLEQEIHERVEGQEGKA